MEYMPLPRSNPHFIPSQLCTDIHSYKKAKILLIHNKGKENFCIKLLNPENKINTVTVNV